MNVILPKNCFIFVETFKTMENYKFVYPTGIELISKEREEQLCKHGRTVEGDVEMNNHYQLSEAAGILTCLDTDDLLVNSDECCPVEWDEVGWKKLFEKPYEQRLVIAGALIAAEIDRLNYIKQQ